MRHPGTCVACKCPRGRCTQCSCGCCCVRWGSGRHVAADWPARKSPSGIASTAKSSVDRRGVLAWETKMTWAGSGGGGGGCWLGVACAHCFQTTPSSHANTTMARTNEVAAAAAAPTASNGGCDDVTERATWGAGGSTTWYDAGSGESCYCYWRRLVATTSRSCSTCSGWPCCCYWSAAAGVSGLRASHLSTSVAALRSGRTTECEGHDGGGLAFLGTFEHGFAFVESCACEPSRRSSSTDLAETSQSLGGTARARPWSTCLFPTSTHGPSRRQAASSWCCETSSCCST
ncbi:hypothetical protein H257_04452 [Aphanomyces astaci]|uniref:Uncharacterized protein n=1 Tax=Aphanomyces astaci TaxID=112090 RepID=W4GVY6_APHAT|nr:hypothetical protein H257_04452 [Aphanomyces astaci]ETV83842.1 hypothetical protein H257_04452 [Aphanomyces astaci]|eukprot:XP_009827272.1 hypothetical protein H257_04452 [Aphanomyces astaci]